MVQIVVRARPDGVPWALLDLQGSIESNTDDLSGLTTGDIVVQPNVRARERERHVVRPPLH